MLIFFFAGSVGGIIDSGLEIGSLNLGMGQSEIPASQILSDDLMMTNPSILRRGVVEGQIENLPSRVNASSSKGSVHIKKTNGCLERSDDRPVLVIQPEQISKDVEYWGKHALIYKFLGLPLSLPVLESWAHRNWNPEGDMEILLAANNYFMVIFSNMTDRNKVFEGVHTSLIVDSTLLRRSHLKSQCGFGFHDCL